MEYHDLLDTKEDDVALSSRCAPKYRCRFKMAAASPVRNNDDKKKNFLLKLLLLLVCLSSCTCLAQNNSIDVDAGLNQAAKSRVHAGGPQFGESPQQLPTAQNDPPQIPEQAVGNSPKLIGKRGRGGFLKDSLNVNQNQRIGHEKIGSRTAIESIAESEECNYEFNIHCNPDIKDDNYAVCMQCLEATRPMQIDEAGVQTDGLSDECRQYLFDWKKQTTTDKHVLEAATKECKDLLEQETIQQNCQKMEGKTGQLVSCLMTHSENVTDVCKHFLVNMMAIVFSDYQLVYKFVENCEKDIDQQKCGRIETENHAQHSQGSTIACLSKDISTLQKLTPECGIFILHIAGLQSEYYVLDRQLFLACKRDRKIFCRGVRDGDGNIYNCLMDNKLGSGMSVECRAQLTRRQALVVQDYKISRKLVHVCTMDIRVHKCQLDDEHKGPGVGNERKLSFVLPCLKNAIHNRNRGLKVSTVCQKEMLSWRRYLMEDYSLSPEIVSNCRDEISGVCNDMERQTIHCLMGRAMERNEQERIRLAQCKIAVEGLLKVADVGENVAADPILEEACDSVINEACQGIQPGNARVMSCLMDNIKRDVMKGRCEKRLLEIYYFIARDFSLDAALYDVCKKDARVLCGAPPQWNNTRNAAQPDTQQTAPGRGPLVFDCLYNHTMHQVAGSRITKNCAREVKRVMRQRAGSVNLLPEVYDTCLNDLYQYCSEGTQKGAELDCLQTQIKNLEPGCYEAVMQFTKMEADDPELNYLLMKACQQMIKNYCQRELESDENPGDLMECLIGNKNKVAHTDSRFKCYTSIHHFQLVSLQSYTVSHKFGEACKDDVEKNCDKKEEKADVVECLSTYMTFDILKDAQQRTITEKCRNQTIVEIFQQAEAIDLNPRLKSACENDLERPCVDVDAGPGQTLECLRQNKAELSQNCTRVLFKQERVMFANPRSDFKLMTKCKEMITKFCHNVEANNVFHCLKVNKNRGKMDSECKNLLVRRMIDQNQDYRLNPTLQKLCDPDITSFCSKEMQSKNDEELQGKVIACLKTQFVKYKLSDGCRSEIHNITLEAAKDYRQNPTLARACKEEVSTHACL